MNGALKTAEADGIFADDSEFKYETGAEIAIGGLLRAGVWVDGGRWVVGVDGRLVGAWRATWSDFCVCAGRGFAAADWVCVWKMGGTVAGCGGRGGVCGAGV